MRIAKKQRRLLEIPRGAQSLHNNIKNRLSLKKGLQLAKDLKLDPILSCQSISADTIVRIIAPTQPRGPLSRVNGMVGKVVEFKKKGINYLVVVTININGKTSKYHVPYSFIRIEK